MRKNKILKCMISFFLVFASMFLCLQGVWADAIIEPERNDFYITQRNNCEYEYRSYLTDGPNGSVKLYESPQENKVTGEIPNGEIVFILFTFKDEQGIRWGVTDAGRYTGWMPLEYMDLVYDHISFCEEHAGKITVMEQGEVVSTDYKDQEIMLWTYPGSADGGAITYDASSSITYDQVFTETNGRQWGYVSYYYGMDGWVCLADPLADYNTLFPDGCTIVHTGSDSVAVLGAAQSDSSTSEPEKGQTADGAAENTSETADQKDDADKKEKAEKNAEKDQDFEDEIQPDDSWIVTQLLITGGLILFVILITVIILVWLWKKK